MVRVPAAEVHKTLRRWIVADGLGVVCDISRSYGDYLHCSLRNADYLDFSGFSSSRPVSFNHPKLNEDAFVRKLGELALHKPCNGSVYTQQYASFVDTFARVALGGAFDHVLFVEGEGAAVDSAVKAAIDWKHRKNVGAGRGNKGDRIISFRQGFHGRTGYALSLSDGADLPMSQYFPRFDWPRVENPAVSFPEGNASLADVEAREQEALQQIAEAFERFENDIAGLIIEPLQSEGGDNHFRTEFLKQLRRICNEREALLIFDEVHTGFGVSGQWWDWQTHAVKPDLLVFGKRCQVSGVAATQRLDEVESVIPLLNCASSAFSGNLVDMARCQRIIEIVEEEDLLAHVRSMGQYLLHVLNQVADAHEEITAVRGRGLLAAFDTVDANARDSLLAACFSEELLVLSCGERSIRLRPGLDVSADAIGRFGAQLEAGICRAFGKQR